MLLFFSKGSLFFFADMAVAGLILFQYSIVVWFVQHVCCQSQHGLTSSNSNNIIYLIGLYFRASLQCLNRTYHRDTYQRYSGVKSIDKQICPNLFFFCNRYVHGEIGKLYYFQLTCGELMSYPWRCPSLIVSYVVCHLCPP